MCLFLYFNLLNERMLKTSQEIKYELNISNVYHNFIGFEINSLFSLLFCTQPAGVSILCRSIVHTVFFQRFWKHSPLIVCFGIHSISAIILRNIFSSKEVIPFQSLTMTEQFNAPFKKNETCHGFFSKKKFFFFQVDRRFFVFYIPFWLITNPCACNFPKTKKCSKKIFLKKIKSRSKKNELLKRLTR